MKAGFEVFARSLFELGNFAERLDEFVGGVGELGDYKFI
jgi:hypothetical protein